jgi:hypothetical protein
MRVTNGYPATRMRSTGLPEVQEPILGSASTIGSRKLQAVVATREKIMKQISVIAFLLTVAFGQIAQTQTGKEPVTKKPAPKVTESKEHAAIRTQYEAKIKECEQRWLDAKTLAESDIKLVNDPSAESGVAQAEARVRLAKLKLGLTIYDILKDKGYKDDPSVACKVHPDGEMSDELDRLEDQLKIVDSCLATYHKTIDKKNADLTVRESEQVKACQSLDLYPPAR